MPWPNHYLGVLGQGVVIFLFISLLKALICQVEDLASFFSPATSSILSVYS